VVALKPHGSPKNVHRKAQKQERRGGIETSPARTSRRTEETKQERRGGIETMISSYGLLISHLKQERRGGIETGERF